MKIDALKLSRGAAQAIETSSKKMWHSKPFIVFLSVVRTSEAEKEDLTKAENIVDFIQKPFDINDLLNKVKKIVG